MERLAQFDDGKGLTFKDAILEANKRKMRIVNNLEIDVRLQGEEWKKEKEKNQILLDALKEIWACDYCLSHAHTVAERALASVQKESGEPK